jgi:hypothetical protein
LPASARPQGAGWTLRYPAVAEAAGMIDGANRIPRTKPNSLASRARHCGWPAASEKEEERHLSLLY